MTIRLQHCGLVVSDLERSRRFYADALGLEEVPRPANFTFDGAWFRFGGTEIHWYTVTNQTLWMVIAVLAIAQLLDLGIRR